MCHPKPDQANTQIKRLRSVFLLIALIATISLSIRYTIASGDALWLDELHTAWSVSDGLSEVAGRAADGNQQPLFFWLTWFCVQLHGSHELPLRLISVVSSVALVAIAGWLVWRASKSLVGVILASLIITLDWRFVFYGTETRPYALMQLLGLLHGILFAEIAGWLPRAEANRFSRSIKWSALTLLSIALFYCHITSVWLFAAEAIVLLWVYRGLKPEFLKPLLLSAFAALAGCLPGFMSLIRLSVRKSNWNDLSSPTAVLSEAREPLLFWMAIPVVLLAIGWLAKKYSRADQPAKQEDPPENILDVFMLCWAITPILGVIAAHYLKLAPLALFRYTLIGVPAMAIFAGLIVGRTHGVALKLVAIGLIAWSSYTQNEITRQLVDRQTLPVLRHENWDTQTRYIRQSGPGYQPILLFANLIEDANAFTNEDPRFIEYLRFPVADFHNVFGDEVFPCPTHHSPHLTEKLIRDLIKCEGGWILIRGSDATVQSIVSEVKQTLRNHLPSDSKKSVRIQERNDDGDVVHLFSVDIR